MCAGTESVAAAASANHEAFKDSKILAKPLANPFRESAFIKLMATLVINDLLCSFRFKLEGHCTMKLYSRKLLVLFVISIGIVEYPQAFSQEIRPANAEMLAVEHLEIHAAAIEVIVAKLQQQAERIKDHDDKLKGHDEKLKDHDSRFDGVDARLDESNKRIFAALDQLKSFESRLKSKPENSNDLFGSPVQIDAGSSPSSQPTKTVSPSVVTLASRSQLVPESNTIEIGRFNYQGKVVFLLSRNSELFVLFGEHELPVALVSHLCRCSRVIGKIPSGDQRSQDLKLAFQTCRGRFVVSQ